MCNLVFTGRTLLQKRHYYFSRKFVRSTITFVINFMFCFDVRIELIGLTLLCVIRLLQCLSFPQNKILRFIHERTKYPITYICMPPDQINHTNIYLSILSFIYVKNTFFSQSFSLLISIIALPHNSASIISLHTRLVHPRGPQENHHYHGL